MRKYFERRSRPGVSSVLNLCGGFFSILLSVCINLRLESREPGNKLLRFSSSRKRRRFTECRENGYFQPLRIPLVSTMRWCQPPIQLAQERLEHQFHLYSRATNAVEHGAAEGEPTRICHPSDPCKSPVNQRNEHRLRACDGISTSEHCTARITGVDWMIGFESLDRRTVTQNGTND